MRDAAEFFVLSWGKLLGVTVAAFAVGGFQYAIATGVSVDREGVPCVSGAATASTDGRVASLVMTCEGSNRAHYTRAAGLLAARIASGQPLRVRCTTYRFTDSVDECE